MNNIENTYVKYDDLVAVVGENVIRSRIEQISQEMLELIKANNLVDVVYVHQMALTHAVMDYFSDVQRLKDYQKIEHINEIKIKAYETFLDGGIATNNQKWFINNQKKLEVSVYN